MSTNDHPPHSQNDYIPIAYDPLSSHTASGRWTCANCGRLVPSGMFHSCHVPMNTGTVWGPTIESQKIIELLERIAKALESAK